MHTSKSSISLFKRQIHSTTYQQFLSQSKETKSSNLYSLRCYFDAIPYLQHCRERRSGVRNESGPLRVIFDCFSEAVEPGKQLYANKLTFEQIDEANSTICLLELLMFCDFWKISSDAFLSRFEISALLRITLKCHPNLSKGVLNDEAFCDLLCYIAIVVYSRPPLQSAQIDTNTKKIKAFIQKFRLNELDTVKNRTAAIKAIGFKKFNKWKYINGAANAPALRGDVSSSSQKTIKLNTKRRSIGKIQIGSMNTLLFENALEQKQYCEYTTKRSSNVSTSSIGVWGNEITKYLANASKSELLIGRRLLQQNVKCDWRKYKGIGVNMKCMYTCNDGRSYKYKMLILNCSSKQIRIDVECDSKIFNIRYNGGYFSRGIQKTIFIESNRNLQRMKNHEKCFSFCVLGINRKGKEL